MFFMVRREGLKNLILDTLGCLDHAIHLKKAQCFMRPGSLDITYLSDIIQPLAVNIFKMSLLEKRKRIRNVEITAVYRS